MMKWFGAFILACMSLLAAILSGLPAAMVNAAVAIVRPDRPPEPGPQFFTVYNELGPGQIAENTHVYVEENLVGQFQLGFFRPRAEITVSVPRPGIYPYRLTSSLYVGLRQFKCHGDGRIQLTAGTRYSLRLVSKDDASGQCIVDMLAIQ